MIYETGCVPTLLTVCLGNVRYLVSSSLAGIVFPCLVGRNGQDVLCGIHANQDAFVDSHAHIHTSCIHATR